MQVRDGPAAVRGDAPAPRRHWPRAGKAVQEGAPSQKTCRSPPTRTPRGRRIRVQASLQLARRRPGGVAARPGGHGRRGPRPGRGQDPEHLRPDGADPHGQRERAGRTRLGQSRGRVLLPRHDHLVRPVHRPDRPLRGRRLDRLGLQGQRRLTAGRRRRGHPQGRRPGALVLGHLRPRRAGPRRLCSSPQGSAGATASSRRTTPARRSSRAGRGCTPAPAACSPATGRGASQPTRGS